MCKNNFSKNVEKELQLIQKYQQELVEMNEFFKNKQPPTSIEEEVNTILQRFNDLFFEIGVAELNKMIGKPN